MHICLYALVECWTCKWYSLFNLITLHVQMVISCVNEHSDHFCVSDCLFDLAMVYCFYSILLDHIIFAPYAFQVFCIQWYYCVVVFQEILVHMFKSLSESRIRCEWVLTLFPNSRLSLESVLGFCHGIAKGGDCKVVIYNYMFCWCREGKFLTYHRLTRHTTKPTKYNQLQSSTYCC